MHNLQNLNQSMVWCSRIYRIPSTFYYCIIIVFKLFFIFLFLNPIWIILPYFNLLLIRLFLFCIILKFLGRLFYFDLLFVPSFLIIWFLWLLYIHLSLRILISIDFFDFFHFLALIVNQDYLIIVPSLAIIDLYIFSLFFILSYFDCLYQFFLYYYNLLGCFL